MGEVCPFHVIELGQYTLSGHVKANTISLPAGDSVECGRRSDASVGVGSIPDEGFAFDFCFSELEILGRRGGFQSQSNLSLVQLALYLTAYHVSQVTFTSNKFNQFVIRAFE